MGDYTKSEDMRCPKCGCMYIHTWLVAICYNCNYEGSRLEFANTEEAKQRELKFRNKIAPLMASFGRTRE